MTANSTYFPRGIDNVINHTMKHIYNNALDCDWFSVCLFLMLIECGHMGV